MELIWQWLASRDWVLTSEFIRNLAAALAALAGFFAIWRWQKELLGKDRYDFAKKISVQVNSLSNRMSFGKSRRTTFIDIAIATPEGFESISSMINSNDYKSDSGLWNELSELQSIVWQSSLLEMPDCKDELKVIENSYFEIFAFEISLQRAINESKDQNEAKPKLNELKSNLEKSLSEITVAKNKILEHEKPYILFKKSKHLFSTRKR